MMSTNKNILTIDLPESLDVEITNMSGVFIVKDKFSPGRHHIELKQNGIYIIKTGGNVYKLII